MNIYQVKIEDLAFGGDGVGSILSPGDDLDGIRCFVPFSVPGDLLKVGIEKKSRRFVRGHIVEVLESSPHRCEAPCPLFGRCGGCSWQHIDYDYQVAAKHNILRQNLLRIGGIDIEPSEAVPSPDRYGYRSRLRMRVLPQGSLAFFAAESRDLVEIGECPLADETLNRLIRSAAAGENTFPPGTTVLMQLVDGEAVWEVEARGNSREKRGSGKKDSPSVENVIGFHQVNEGVNLLVREKVLEIARRRAGDRQRAGNQERAGDRGLSGSRVLDLYCGNGNLSLPLAEAGAHVAGYDTDGASLEEAKRAYKKTPEGGQLFLKKMDALGAVREVSTGKVRPFGSHSPDLVILDPPRGGVGDEGMKGICGTGAGTILYVSCDPATLARDLKEAVGQGYRVAEAIPFDMFPQTSHFETLVVLER